MNAAGMNTIVGYVYDMLYGDSGGFPSYASCGGNPSVCDRFDDYLYQSSRKQKTCALLKGRPLWTKNWIMDKPKNGTGKKSQSWQDRNLYFSDVLGARGAVSVLLDAFNLRKSYGSYNAEHIPKLFTLSPTLQNYADAFTSAAGQISAQYADFHGCDDGADDGRDHALRHMRLHVYPFREKIWCSRFSVPDDDSGGAGHDHQLRDDHTVGHAQQLCRIGTAVRDLGILHLFIERKF